MTGPMNSKKWLAASVLLVLALLASGLPLFAILQIFGGVRVAAVFVCFAAAAMSAGSPRRRCTPKSARCSVALCGSAATAAS